MILELDAGNSRIKWRLVDPAAGGRKKVAEGSVWALEKVPSVFIELGQQLESLPLTEVERLLVADVRGAPFREAFSSLMTEKWRLRPEFAVAERRCGGVTNAYDDPESLGVDRWLAMLAAWRDAGTACCVVGFGSAITLDLVDREGRHQGGYIVPGIEIMREALGARSRALQFSEPARWEGVEPGRSTREAVEHGILGMVMGLLRGVRGRYDEGSLRWYLAGGDARLVSRRLDWEHRLVPDLVMDGLSIALP